MPELPEVLTISKDLKREVVGKKVVEVVNYNNYKLNPSKEHFNNFVVNSTIEDVFNIAKLIVIKLSSKQFIATHLNMTGRLLYNTKDPYVKITLKLNDNSLLHYSSVRMFGYFEVKDESFINDYYKRYGKTALDTTLTLKEFKQKIKSKNTAIKHNLLNQKLISGIGNIYANDALFLSKIHPKAKTASLSEQQIKDLFNNVKLILNEGIIHRGSTIDRYADLYGKPGSHQNHFRVYGKKGKNCINCNNPISFEQFGGRGTYYCPNCQTMQNSTQGSLF